MDETKPVQEIEQRTSALAHDAAARGAEKLQSYDVSGGVRAVSRALHRAAECFEEDGYRSMASITHRAAGSFDRLGESVRGREPVDLLREVQRYAHQNPTVFIAGCALLGVAVSRFLTTTTGEPRVVEEERYEEPVIEASENVPVAPESYGEPIATPPSGGMP